MTLQHIPGSFDPLLVGWHVSCACISSQVLIRLEDMRRITPLAGARTPPAFVIDFQCPACTHAGRTLIAQDALDLQPVLGLAEPTYDFMTGSSQWDPSLLSGAWLRSMQRGHWPLVFGCLRCEDHVPGWPSLLHRISPQGAAFLVERTCPQCERADVEQLAAPRLSLLPASA